MWGGSGSDPGGTKGEEPPLDNPSSQELNDLKDQFEQQQVLIAQLKEMLRKTEQTSLSQEKVEEYANTLTRMSFRAKKNKLRKEKELESQSEVTPSIKKVTIDTPAKEKILLLRQQVEENKQKLAERGKVQKDIEETVTQLKAQFADSQQRISQTSLNLSLSEPKFEKYSINSTQEELFNLLTIKDKRINELNLRIQKLEGNVLDLQENVKEKDSVIDARTKAITLMSESLSKKGKTTLDALDDTKEQMRKMQENFVGLEMEIKNENAQLMKELEEKNNEIKTLKEDNNRLEQTCSKQREEILHLTHSLEKSEPTDSLSDDLNKQIEILNNRITELQQLNDELQESSQDSLQHSSKRGKKGQKRGQSKDKKGDSDLQKQLNTANEDIEKHLHKITELELTITELNVQLEEFKSRLLVQSEVVESDSEIAKLKKQLDESNKSMIKIKAQHKGKIKELNKKIEELKKGVNNEEISRLQAENSKLIDRIDVLEEEKVNMGLDESCSSSIRDSGASERVKELEVRLMEQNELIENKNAFIITLEEELELQRSKIQALKEHSENLSQLKSAQVVSEMASIHFEEQLDKLEMEKKELISEKSEMIMEHDTLLEKIEALNKDKQELSSKLDSYMQENMELIDKLEKLSAEKVSSAESIEIVESLTQQEKLELEEYQKGLEVTSGNIKNSTENLEENPELNESVNQLTEETSDLLRKIELFTEERREVMEKMEALSAENHHLNIKIHEIENNRDILADTYEHLQNTKEALESRLQEKGEKVKVLETSLDELRKENETLREKLGYDDHVIKQEKEVEEDSYKEKNLELQQHIDEYKKLIEVQRQEIQELKMELLSQKDLGIANKDLHEKVSCLQAELQSLLTENEKLSKTVKEQSEVIHEKDTIELELVDVKKRLEELNDKLTNNLDEIENYKSIIEENKGELVSSAKLINDLQAKVEEKECQTDYYKQEIAHLNSVVSELNNAITHLENENCHLNETNNSMELMSNQFQELKMVLNENIKQTEVYEKELEQNSNTISKLNIQLKDLNKKLLEMEHDLECKDDEIKKLIKERDNKEIIIMNLQSEIKRKDEKFHSTCETLKEKYLVLQNQIEENVGSLENIKNPMGRIEELENKNKEQLEKMKKIAANLKKKTAAYQELEVKYKQNVEKWEIEEKEKAELQSIITTHENKITELQEKLDMLFGEFNEVEKELVDRKNKMQDLIAENMQLKVQNEELIGVKQNYEMQLNIFTTEAELHRSAESNNLNMEINEKNEIIRNLKHELESTKYNLETTSNALYAKIQELEMLNETQQSELVTYKENIVKLEEVLSAVEERRMSLEKKAIELGAQLQEKSSSYEEISQTEDILEQRLATLMAHEDKIQKLLQETNTENQNLIQQNRFLIDENDQLKHKLSAATERNLYATTNQEKISYLQDENLKLNDVIVKLENEIKQSRAEFETKLNKKKNEVESLEIELQEQLEQLDGERKTLLVQCEQLQDKVKESDENLGLLKDDIEQYKQKLEQQQIDFEIQIVNFQQINNENKQNLSIIEQLNREIESIKSDSDKNKIEFQKLLTDKEVEVENYKHQNLQLQMQNSSAQSEKLESMKKHVAELERLNQELKVQNSDLQEKNKCLEKNAFKLPEDSEKPQTQDISTFVWPEPSYTDPFNFVVDTSSQNNMQNIEQPVQKATDNIKLEAQHVEQAKINLYDNTKEELLKKIKTLEFILYDVEKEKEDVLEQCQELTNEIARLIYERQVSLQLQSQICSEAEAVLKAEDLAELKELEFTTSKEPNDMHDSAKLLPVIEDPIQPTSTYLCYKKEPCQDNKAVAHPKETLVNVEPLIVSISETETTKGDLKPLQHFEFETTKPLEDIQIGGNRKPVVEDILQPTATYLCYQSEAQIPHDEGGAIAEKDSLPSTSTTTNLDVFIENDDGWGCNPGEVKLEEDTKQALGDNSTRQSIDLPVEDIDERVRVLEVERERHLEEIKQAQIKSAKLIKKLKEMKALNGKLNADLRKSSGFGELDDAIQDELKSQIASLEKKVKESTFELEKEKADKKKLLKKNESLQVINERLMDMKEKQEVEILSWQIQNRELSTRLEQFDWGQNLDSPKHSKSNTQSESSESNNLETKIEELTNIIKDLTLDNEELQTLLEEQRTLRINIEKARSVEPIAENMKSETDYLNIVKEKNNLNEQLKLSVEEKKNLQEQLNNLIKSNGELQRQIQMLVEEKLNLEMRIVDDNNRLQELNLQLESFKVQNQNFTNNNELEKAYLRITELEEVNSNLSDKLTSFEEINKQLISKSSNISVLENNLEILNQEKVDLINELEEVNKLMQEKNIKIDQLNEIILESEQDKIKLVERIHDFEILSAQNKENLEKLHLKEDEVLELSKQLELAVDERSALTTSIQQLTQEWSQRVDQRGADVGECWKLHLETRENEFMQIEQQLKKEINEFEEKCNALVNENNELRKNVDAEIRNEVDKISALQQQINDRQHYINELTQVLQENQANLEQQKQKILDYESHALQMNQQMQDKNVRITEVEAKVLSLQMDIEDKMKIIDDLTQQLDELGNLQVQLVENKNIILDLQHDLEMKQKTLQEYIEKLNEASKESEKYKENCSLLQIEISNKDLLINEMNNKIQEIQTQKSNKDNNEVNLLEQQVNELTLNLQDKLSYIKNANEQHDKDLQFKDIEIKNLKEEINTLQHLLNGKEQQYLQLQQSYQETDNWSKQLKESVESKENEIISLNMEIEQLKSKISENEKEYSSSLAVTVQESENIFQEKAQELDILKSRISEMESHHEALLIAKDSDIVSIQSQLHDQMNKNEILTKEKEDTLNELKHQLGIKEQECEELQRNICEQDVLYNEENKQLTELGKIIEDQVMKIESLKQELYEKSKDYDSLIAELDIRNRTTSEPSTPPPIEKQEEFIRQLRSSNIASPSETDQLREDSDTSQLANRAEMDLALYMLHQRDMRCEELTVELMQLLEERDTLQLKLSNSLREKEELKKKIQPLPVMSESPDEGDLRISDVSTSSTPKTKSKTSAIVLGATGTELAMEATEHLQREKDSDALATKLFELKSVGYKRDKTLLDEQEQRRLQQISLMQQHRDVAAMLPAEAAAKLVHDATYTLSRDVQSPPRVLLNWLWGRSTPKVNDV